MSDDPLKRIGAADDLLTAGLARLPSAERMRHAPTVGVVKVLLSGVRKLPAAVPGGADGDWVALLDKLEPQFDLCESAATVKDLTHRFEVLDERIGRILGDVVALAAVIEPHCSERERLVRLTMLAQQEILMLGGAQLDGKLARIEAALARHRKTDETRTGLFHESLRAFDATFTDQTTRRATEHDLRVKQWEDEFGVLADRLRNATGVDRITSFYSGPEQQERIRVNTYAALCVTFITIAIIAAGFGFCAHQTTRSISTIAGSVTLFTLLSSAAAIMRREQAVHRNRLWAVENDHRRMVGSVLFYPNMTDVQRERFLVEFFNATLMSELPKQQSTTPAPRAAKSHSVHKGETT